MLMWGEQCADVGRESSVLVWGERCAGVGRAVCWCGEREQCAGVGRESSVLVWGESSVLVWGERAVCWCGERAVCWCGESGVLVWGERCAGVGREVCWCGDGRQAQYPPPTCCVVRPAVLTSASLRSMKLQVSLKSIDESCTMNSSATIVKTLHVHDR